MIEAAGARVEPLPAYSSDFNPKEECIPKVKAELKLVKAKTKRELKNALQRAYAKVTLTDISRLVSALWLFRSLNIQIETALVTNLECADLADWYKVIKL